MRIAPTVLSLLGLPVGADMPGRVLVDAFVEAPAVQRIESWENLPGADGPTLIASIGTLLERYPDEAVVYPGHMAMTTLGDERASNPVLASLVR